MEDIYIIALSVQCIPTVSLFCVVCSIALVLFWSFYYTMIGQIQYRMVLPIP